MSNHLNWNASKTSTLLFIFQIVLKTECLPCPAGMDCSNPKEPEICGTKKVRIHYTIGSSTTSSTNSSNYRYVQDEGLYPNYDSIGCRDCEFGFYCYFGIKEDCPPGTYCNRNRIVYPEPCPAGSYCKGGSQIDPIRCPVKKYSEVGWNECESCPARFFCDGGIKQNCPKGTDLKFSDTILYFQSILPV